MSKNLAEVIGRFPSEQHVKDVCRPGKGSETCRYLMMGRGWECGKTSMKHHFDERVAKGEMHARGDNCDGLLGELLKNQATLVGKRVLYEESMPSYRASGVFKEMKLENGTLSIIADWEKEGEDFNPGINVDYLNVSVSPTAIRFNIAGLGNFGGTTTILLN